MSRQIAVLAEVIQGSYDPASEMMMPDAIDDHARRERVVARAEPPGQRETPARSTVMRGLCLDGMLTRIHHHWETRLHQRAVAVHVPVIEEIGRGSYIGLAA